MNIAVVGAGYAGLVTAACLADIGHDVGCIEIDPARVAALRTGRAPFFEPGLDSVIERMIAAGRLRFVTADAASHEYRRAAVVFIVVGTPRLDDGNVDLNQVFAAVENAAPHLRDGVVVVVKSTVPVGTTREATERLREMRPDLQFHSAANPEFLRQGAAVIDFEKPDRIVLGVSDATAERVLRELFAPFIDSGVKTLVTTPESAELIKYAANAFLATKLSFINEIADLCEASGAEVEEVTLGLGLDRRIGPAFLRPGPGFGGACLPKDTHALLHTHREFGTGSRIVGAALAVNEGRIHRMVEKVEEAVGSPLPGLRIGVLGITFKADTDDVRESPAIDIVNELAGGGSRVRVFDPRGLSHAKPHLLASVEYATDAYDAITGADVMVIATEWPEFGALDLDEVRSRLARPLIVDLRNVFDPEKVAAAGIAYHSIGRRTR